jgi:serine/threonine protein kinase/tetratricopeptide (TPR) repeat protein
MAVPTKCSKCSSDNPETVKFCGECGTQLIPPDGPQVSKTLTLETSAEELHRGTVFSGRYEILEELGTGGMGRVYRVFDRKLEEEVALKLIRPDIAASRKTIERFKNELKVARKITHPNVCRMHDLHEEKKTLYITMEYVRGEDLKSVIHRMGTLTTGKALSIAHQVAEGLAEAHKLGIIHRDLKPGNIIIDKEGNAKILDFGIARMLAVAGTTAEGTMIGTPEYMSPEQVEGKPADARSDLYSLGVILFEMVTGQPPFEGETPVSIAHKHKYEPAPDPQKLNPQVQGGLKRVILRSLEKDPGKRYQTTEELVSDLAAVEVGLPTAERVTPKRKTFTRRKITVEFQPRKLVIPGAVLIVIAAAALVFMPSLFRKKTPVVPKIENSIAVISFENLTGSSTYNDLIKAIPSLFITKFESMGFSYVATLERLRDLLKQMDKDPWAPIDTGTGFAACQRQGIGAMVVGSITKAGDIFAIDVKVLNVETKMAIVSASSRGQGEESILLTQIDDLAGQITEKLGGRALSDVAVQPVSKVTTSSMEAYNFYIKGQEASDKFYFEEARQYFLKAVEIDPAFAVAYRGLAIAYRALGLIKEASKAIEKAMSLADRTTPKEKLFIQSSYVTIVEGDLGLEKNIQINRQLIEKFPKEKEAHYWLGDALWRVYMRGRAYEDRQDQALLDEVIREMQTALDLDPDYTRTLDGLITANAQKGDLGKALEYAKRLEALAPGEANSSHSLGDIYLQTGQLDLAIESFKKALSIKPDFFWSCRAVGYAYGLKENYPESIRWANEYAERSTVAGHKAEGFELKAFYEYWTGSFQKALEDAEKFRVAGDEIQNWAYSAYSFFLKGAIFRFQKKFNLSQEAYIQSYDIFIKNLPRFVYLNELAKEVVLGSIDIEAGNIEGARKRLITVNRLLSENKNPVEKKALENIQRILRGKLLIEDGHFADAISNLEELRTEVARNQDYYGLSSSSPAEIYELNLESSCRLETDLARAYEMKGDIDKAIGVLERRARFDASKKDFRLVPPKVYYDLGRLYEKKGLEAKAKNSYAKFLDLWKNADRGLPEVEDTRKRLAGLQQ